METNRLKKMKIPYKLSRDYKRLKELLDSGNRIVCFADYRFSKNELPCRDVCTARRMPYDELGYSIGSRGVCYADWMELVDKEFTFEENCLMANIEFIDI